MNYFKVISLLFLFVFCKTGFAQNQQIKKADKLYKLNEYSQAISLYEVGLKEEESLSAKTKLAYCYKMTNKLSNAERLYSEIVNEERARPITNYYYGEALMSNGKYEEAKNWFIKYADLNPNDDRAYEMIAACERVGSLKPLFENLEIKSFEQNSKSDDSGSVFYQDGIVFTSDRNSGANPLEQKSGWTGRDFQRIYYSKADSTGAYSKPQVFSKKLNELNKHCGTLSFNSDQNFVVFTRTGTNAGKNDAYNMQLYYSESSKGSKWKKPKVISFCKKDNNYMHPALSTDGNTLYFVSDKPGGEGGTDIYKSKRTEKGWGTPLNLGTEVNTSFNEGFPFISSEGNLYFSSKGHSGYGGFDIFLAEQDAKGLWSKPRNVGVPLNSSFDDISFHLDDTFTKGTFSSSRDGNNDNIYIFEITPTTIVNSEIEKPENVYVRKALKPTAVDVSETSDNEIVAEENVDNNQLKSEVANGAEQDSNSGAESVVVATQIIAETAGKPEENIEIESIEIVNTEDSEDFADIIISNNNAEIENAEFDESNEFNETIITEQDPVVEIVESNEIVIENFDNQLVENNPKEETSEPFAGNNIMADNTEEPEMRSVNVTPTPQTGSAVPMPAPTLFKDRPMPTVFPFVQMKYLLKKGIDVRDKTFRINGVQFEKGKYIITPEIALKLNLLIDILEKHPDLEVEIAAHSNSIGDNAENLEVSRARAGAIAAHLVNRGIAAARINAEGYGENRLLNRCANGVNCSEKEHNVNERIELAIF